MAGSTKGCDYAQAPRSGNPFAVPRRQLCIAADTLLRQTRTHDNAHPTTCRLYWAWQHQHAFIFNNTHMKHLVFAALAILGQHLSADTNRPFLHGLFTDNAVIQRGVKAPVWGWTTPGATVGVIVAETEYSAVADADGRWEAQVGPCPAGGPYDMEIRGPESLTLHNILFGDIWLCSGQSNMEMGLGVVTNGAAEVAAANFPRIRLYSVPHDVSNTPKDSINTNWFECRPDTIPTIGNTVWGGFSGPAYFLGRDLHRELDVPIGLICASWGGTIIEAWSSEESLQRLGGFEELLAVRNLSVEDWLGLKDPGSRQDGNWAAPTFDPAAWPTMTLPARWEESGLPNFDGIVWFRRDVEIPADWVGQDLLIALGPIDDADTTWVNGERLGDTGGWTIKRRYTVPANRVTSRSLAITVRVLDVSGGGGLFGRPEYMQLSRLDATNDALSLAGPWSYQPGLQLTPELPRPGQGLTGDPNQPALLYHAMIAPLQPFALKGFFWYQGEFNDGMGARYTDFLLELIKALRLGFRNADLPALVVQLPFFMKPQSEPVEKSGWIDIRDAQLQAAHRDKHTALVVTLDAGDRFDIHPPNKQAVGERAALAALGTVYGQTNRVWSGPLFREIKQVKNSLVLSFDHAGKGLKTSDGGKLRGFALAGNDEIFHWADATIVGKRVVINIKGMTGPFEVRYAWAINPDCNLVNSAGLPASPFQTR